MEDHDFEQLGSVKENPKKIFAVTDHQGGNELDASVLYGAQVIIRSSAVNAKNEDNDRNAHKETLVEAILSHEVGGHAKDITTNFKDYQQRHDEDKKVDYFKRRNEVSADQAAKVIGIERVAGGFIKLENLRSETRLGGTLLPQ